MKLNDMQVANVNTLVTLLNTVPDEQYNHQFAIGDNGVCALGHAMLNQHLFTGQINPIDELVKGEIFGNGTYHAVFDVDAFDTSMTFNTRPSRTQVINRLKAIAEERNTQARES